MTASGGEFTHGFTYSGHPVACAAGDATVKIYQETDLLETISNTQQHVWAKALSTLSTHPIVGEVRSKGMLGAVELVREPGAATRIAPDAAAAVFCRNYAIQHGLMARQVGDSLILSPPLIISTDEIEQLVTSLRAALDATATAFGVAR